MRPALAMRITAGVAFSLVSFTALASIIFLAAPDARTLPSPFWQWWLYLFEASSDTIVRHWLIASGVPAAAVPLLTGIVLLRGRAVHGWTLRRGHPPAERLADPIRSPTDNQGHARWIRWPAICGPVPTPNSAASAAAKPVR